VFLLDRNATMGVLNQILVVAAAISAGAVAQSTSATQNSTTSSDLPVVDLGYELHQAYSHNVWNIWCI